jgi:hypothetical protein
MQFCGGKRIKSFLGDKLNGMRCLGSTFLAERFGRLWVVLTFGILPLRQAQGQDDGRGVELQGPWWSSGPADPPLKQVVFDRAFAWAGGTQGSAPSLTEQLNRLDSRFL